MATARRRFIVRYRGNVQGVGFRMTAIAQAGHLAIDGFVRNEPDGSVLMDVEGRERDLQELMSRIANKMDDNIMDVVVDQRDPQDRGGGFRIEY